MWKRELNNPVWTTQSKSITFCCVSVFGDKQKKKKSQKKSLNPYHFVTFPLIMVYMELFHVSACLEERHWSYLFQNIFLRCVYNEQPWQREIVYPSEQRTGLLTVFDIRDGVSLGAKGQHTCWLVWAQNSSSLRQPIKWAGVS